MKNSHFDNFFQQSVKLFKAYTLGIIIFFLFRLIFFFRFGDFSLFNGYSEDINRAFLQGFRFDSMMICYSLGLVVLVNLLLLIISSDKYHKFTNRFSQYYLVFAFSTFSLALICDQQFYNFFQNHFNLVALSFFKEQPDVLMLSIWEEHPIIRIVLIIIGLIFIYNKILKKIYTYSIPKIKVNNLIIQVSFVVFFAFAYFVGLRESLGTFPLQMDESTVSQNEFINTLTPNGIYTGIDAIKKRNHDLKHQNPKEILKQYGYKTIQEALADYYGKPASEFDENVEKYLFKKSSKKDSLKNEKPHVVFLLMESMSRHFMNFQNKEFNILGKFEKHTKEDFLFKNFFSSTNGTISSTENLLLNSPYRICESSHRFKKFDASVAKTFKNMNYETNFCTGLQVGWRNLNQYLPNLYFDNVEGKYTILKKNPKAQSNSSWGVYDHDAFNYIFQKLENSNGKPQFVFSLSSTNHTPYELPSDYKCEDLVLPKKLKDKVLAKEDVARNCFTAYRYSNDAVGTFIEKVKKSKFAENTIIIVTGDHNIRSMLPYVTDPDMLLKYSVPFYIYLPKKYRKKVTYDYRKYGSHNDIFPTLFETAFSDVGYFGLGSNLFDKNIKLENTYCENAACFKIPTKNNKEKIGKKVNARKAILAYYFNQCFKVNLK